MRRGWDHHLSILPEPVGNSDGEEIEPHMREEPSNEARRYDADPHNDGHDSLERINLRDSHKKVHMTQSTARVTRTAPWV